jgi:CheY-like chemotaxis protein
MNLLVVDDDSIIRMLLRTLLTAEGYRVITAADGEEALAKLAEQKIDLIISDVYMPVVNGIQLRGLVRSLPQTARMPFLFISGHNEPYATEAVHDQTLEGFHRKGQPYRTMLLWIKYLTSQDCKRPKVRGIRKSMPESLIHRRGSRPSHHAQLM